MKDTDSTGHRASWLLARAAALALLGLGLLAPVPGARADVEPDTYDERMDAYEHERPEPPAGRKIYDAAILRPFGFVQVLASAAMYGVFYLPALATGTTDELTEICITEPVEQTFRKPLGEL